MLSLSLMARLPDDARPDARLVLVGDPQQLASVEAGAVLGDVVGPAAGGWRMSRPAGVRLRDLTGIDEAAGGTVGPGPGAPVGPALGAPGGQVPGAAGGPRLGAAGGQVPGAAGGPRLGAAGGPVPGAPGGPVPGGPGGPVPGAIGDGIVHLPRVHRFGGRIARLAAAIAAGDAAGAVGLLSERSRRAAVVPILTPSGRTSSRPAGPWSMQPGGAGTGRCARRPRHLPGLLRPSAGSRRSSAAWNDRIERWLASSINGYASGGPGMPRVALLVTANDYEVQLFNGDTGVTVARPDTTTGGVRTPGPHRRGGAGAASLGRDRPRHDHPQESGLPVRRGGGRAARR